MAAIYDRKADAIAHEIVAAIEANDVVKDAYSEYDIDAIADAVIIGEVHGTEPRFMIDEDMDFWQVVADNAR